MFKKIVETSPVYYNVARVSQKYYLTLVYGAAGYHKLTFLRLKTSLSS